MAIVRSQLSAGNSVRSESLLIFCESPISVFTWIANTYHTGYSSAVGSRETYIPNHIGVALVSPSEKKVLGNLI